MSDNNNEDESFGSKLPDKIKEVLKRRSSFLDKYVENNAAF